MLLFFGTAIDSNAINTAINQEKALLRIELKTLTCISSDDQKNSWQAAGRTSVRILKSQ